MNQLSLLVEANKSIPITTPESFGNESAIASDNANHQILLASFSEIVGQTLAKSLLQNAIANSKISSAYLFKGIDGIGKTLAARVFISQLLNTNSFTNHPDLLWVEPKHLHQGNLVSDFQLKETGASPKSPPQIRLEQIREVTRFLSSSALTSRKVVVIAEADQMNAASANALLKTLEEPKGSNCIILVSSKPQLLLTTISSRCATIPFHCLTCSELAIVLEKLEKSQILLQQDILAMAVGSPGQAISYYDLWQSISSDLLLQLEKPPSSFLEALQLSSSIKVLEQQQQIWLLDYIQYTWWTQYQDKKLVAKVESAKLAMNKSITPRLIWDVLLLP